MRRSELSSSLQALIKYHCVEQGMYKISVFDCPSVEQMDSTHLIGWSLCMVDERRLAPVEQQCGQRFGQKQSCCIEFKTSEKQYVVKVQPMGSAGV